ncbi:MAG: tRNA (adenosine(37)-N6)-dimethylallyltransferase MiaA [Candidatus Omnitrophica bacterium]|nr:tRNA (adenosine(37)-N6)-dimethylallyltransferase MiaA [Candidatus Omnitrophota bacterium]
MKDEPLNKRMILFIVGPTSSGKTAVAVEAARKINGEIISCDSMQVYRDMDVITGTPGEDIMRSVPHYLIKCVPPEEEYNAARFAKEAGALIDDIVSRGRMPVITGGTGLYMKALIDGIFPASSRDEDLRGELKKEAAEKGAAYLYERLKKADPVTARALHPNDVRRVIRALEVYELTGETIHDQKKGTRGIGPAYDCRIFGMELARSLLYERINRAVDRMFDKGLVEEVGRLRQRRLSSTAEKALGVKEISSYLEGTAGRAQAGDELKKNTRRYAKRQLTWFRADERVEWLDAGRGVREIAEDILRRVNE